jgi:alpha-tubulin suppressor-like RCC1 family protein
MMKKNKKYVLITFLLSFLFIIHPSLAVGDSPLPQIAAGNYHTVAIKSDNSLWAWGINSNGQLGDGSGISRFSPVQIATGVPWVSVAAGSDHTIALKSDGTLWTWGNNNYGQLGDGTTVNKFAPVQVGTDTTWIAVAAGNNHSFAIKANGTLWAWGDNYTGQLGDGTTTERHSPVQIGTDTTWASVAAGNGHTVALKSNIESGSTWVSVAAGNSHSFAIKTNGTLWAWGHNMNGQLGDGTTSYRFTPVQIGTDTWSSVSAGSYHTVALKSDGTLWAWGYNGYGQLGDSTTTDKNYPVQIGTDSDWSSAVAGSYHTVALKSDGTLWSWGYNGYGQLGDGSTNDSHYPVYIGDFGLDTGTCHISFSDVPPGHWAEIYISEIACEGIATGYGDGTYRPTNQVNRAQMAIFIIRALYGDDFSYGSTPYFPDVPDTHWAFKYIQRMYEEGIAAGYGDGTYGPLIQVNRAQMAIFIIRALYGDDFSYGSTPYFPDVPDTHWAFKYIQRMNEEGIAAGYGDGTYQPLNVVNRAQMAIFIARGFLDM